MRSVRTVVRTLIAGFLALAGPALAAPAVLAHAQEIQQQSSRTAVSPTTGAASRKLTLSIDGVSPNFAVPASTVRVSGTLTNHTGSAITSASIQLLTYPQVFFTRSDMDSFARGHSAHFLQQAGTPSVTGRVANGATVRWTVSFSPALAGYGGFGVYPVEVAAAATGSSYQATDRTLLPFWPGKGAAKALDTAWIWPLIDRPQQGACSQTLATNSLAASLDGAGRLGTLLAAGQRWADRDHLTWAIDPALLSDVNVMTRRYKVGGSSECTGAKHLPASAAATSWLSTLRGQTAGQPVLLTPYADADVSALTHAGMDQNLRTAYRLGESVAGKILPPPFGITETGTGNGGTAAIAWPAGGMADASVATSLASNGGIRTLVLSSGELPPVDAPFDNALDATTTGIGTTMGVLLADSGIAGVLAGASASSSAGSRFAAEQNFLAETAMISAEAPYLKRALVVAPPRRWNPSAAEANALLSLTSAAPWLRPVELSSFAAAAGRVASRQALPGTRVSRAELSAGFLGQVSAVDSSTALYKDLLYQPSATLLDSLDAAVAATTSTAWRGPGAAGGWLALGKLANYLSDAEEKVQIITGKKILLAGASGDTPVSVQNLLPLPVQVRVVATVPADSQVSVGKFDNLLVVPPMKTGTVRMPVHSTAIGTTTMQLQLATKNGSPLTWTAQSLSVQATRYGRALLVLIAAALGVLVLTSVARWVRRWLRDGKAGDSTEGKSGGTG
jgi:uncharacterized protein DUF6049